MLLGLVSTFILNACGGDLPEPLPQKIGNVSAPILIEEFADLECPACGVVSPEVKKFVLDNPDLVRLDYYHFPLSMHQYAFMASEAAECAADQGKFWEYTETIFANQKSLNEDYLYKVADSLALDRTKFDDCTKTNKYKSKVQSHMVKGNQMGVSGTPTLYVNGTKVQWTDPETFKAYLETLNK